MLEYLDFDLEIGEGEGGKYPVVVLTPAGKKPRGEMVLPFDENALALRLRDLELALLRSTTPHRRTKQEREARQFGTALFEALFAGEVRGAFEAARQQAAKQGKGLRVRLRIQPPELAALPWEYLYDPVESEHLCLSQYTPLVRFFATLKPPEPWELQPPLRILGMVANPPDLPRLNVEKEVQSLETALRPLIERQQVTLTWLKDKNSYDLQRALGRGPWHVFHFIGHGGFDPEANEGQVALTGADGKAEYIRATRLATLLGDHRPLRLAVLNACEGATGSQDDLFSSTASVLVRRNLPAVIGMQYVITDEAAIRLSQVFYEYLGDGQPVDAALAEARKALSLAKQDSLEWAAPVLHLRAPDGVLFRLAGVGQEGQQKAAAQVVGAPPAKPAERQEIKAVPPLKEKPALSGKMAALHRRMTDPDWTPADRALAADELDKLGWLPDDLYTFVAVPGYSYPFYIARYPVTNAQYERFLQAPDFADDELWADIPKYDENYQEVGNWGYEGWRWLQANWNNEHKVLPRYWDDANFGIARRGVPVVRVTWYEASAYCKWLHKHWDELEEARQNPGLRPELVRLPLEGEWILAGGGIRPTVRYPWDAPGKATGDAGEILRRANVNESGLGRTTPVGMYPLGASPHGVWDMAGNVWEWQANYYDKDHNTLGLRGGSWISYVGYARLSARDLNHPFNDWGSGGFRVLVFPS